MSDFQDADRKDLLTELYELRSRVEEVERDRLRSREASERSERRQQLLATAVESVRQGIAITDARLDGEGPRLLFVNEHFCVMSGYTSEELVGQSMGILRDPTMNQPALESWARELTALRPWQGELIHRRKEGSSFVVTDQTSPVTDANGQLTYLVSIQQDITEQKLAEQALQSSEERYRLLIERMNEGFVATDSENQVNLVNAKLATMLGYSAEEMRGHHLGDFTDGVNRKRLAEQEARRHHGVAEPYELTWISKRGRSVDTIVSPTSQLRSDGTFIGSFAVVTDVTERKRLEKEKRKLQARSRKAQKMESLGLLAGGIAHDFNNLLVGILGHASLALMDLPEDSPVQPLIQQVETAAIRASELTQEMLAYSGKGRFVVERIDLPELVEEMVNLLETTISKKAELVLDFESRVPLIEGDPTQIRQVVMNLMTNASEALGDKSGTIRVSGGSVDVGKDYLAETYLDDDLPAGRYVFLEVSDTGSGMDKPTRSKIFDPFFSTKFTGRGLGLAAVLGIVRGHKGAIQVYSEVDRGTSFKVLLPAVEGAVASPEPLREETSEMLGDGCVLIVDDEEMVRRVAKLTLEGAGYSVLLAADGVEAIEVFREHGDRLSAVLLDLTMPRMSGEETLRELRNLRQDINIILVSGFNEQEAVHRFEGEQLAAFLQKPFQPRELLAALRDVLRG